MTASPLPTNNPDVQTPVRLGQCAKGWRGMIHGLSRIHDTGLDWAELERRLLEMGFVEGARVEIRHDGPIRRDPIAVRVDDITIAVRRRDADAILVCAAE